MVVRSKIYLLLLILFVAVPVSAIFKVDISPDSRTIRIDETAEFRLSVIQNYDKEYYFEIYSPDVQWDITTDPTSDRILDAKPGTARSTTLQVRPLYVNPGYYAIPINIKRSGTNDLVRKNVLLSVLPEQDVGGEYSPAVRTEVTLPEKIDPRKEILVKVELQNQNRRKLDNVDVKLRSELINKDYTTTLNPLETKELEFKVRLDQYTEPGEDYLKITVFATAGNNTVQFDVPMIKYKILPIGDIDRDIKITDGFLVNTKEIILTNKGNVKKTFEYEEKANFAKRFFMKADPGAVIKEKNGAAYMYWEIEVAPNEQKTITIKTNYNYLLIAILMTILTYVAYLRVRKPITLNKAAMIISTKQGGLSELKVMISVKNRSKNEIQHVIVHDKVPSIAQIEKDFDVGTLKPEKITPHSGNTIIKWDLGNLEGYGERILSYKIKTKLSVLGGLRLPTAQAKFPQFNKTRISVSKVENLFGR